MSSQEICHFLKNYRVNDSKNPSVLEIEKMGKKILSIQNIRKKQFLPDISQLEEVYSMKNLSCIVP